MLTSKAEALKRVDELEKRVDVFVKGTDALEKRALEQAEELKEQKALYEELRKTDNKIISDLQSKLDGLAAAKPAYEALRSIVEPVVREELKKSVSVGSNPTGTQDVTLKSVRTTVHIKEEKKALPEISTLKTDGKILLLARDGYFDSEKRPSDVIGKLSGIPGQTVRDALASLAERGLLLEKRQSAGNKAYVNHPDVEYV